MNGLVLEIRGLHAIVLMPGGELRRVPRRRGWRVGMVVDPDAVRSGGFFRAAAALAMVLMLMLGLGAYRAFAPRGGAPVAGQSFGRVPLVLPTPDWSPVPTAAAPSATVGPSAAPTPAVTFAASSANYNLRRHDVDRDDDHDDDHDDHDDRCDSCGRGDHDDDDCPYAPPGWDDDDDDD